MTKHFSKWASKQRISENELKTTLLELQEGNFDANLGGYLYKKRIRFEGQGKRGSGRTIICYNKGINYLQRIIENLAQTFRRRP